MVVTVPQDPVQDGAEVTGMLGPDRGEWYLRQMLGAADFEGWRLPPPAWIQVRLRRRVGIDRPR